MGNTVWFRVIAATPSGGRLSWGSRSADGRWYARDILYGMAGSAVVLPRRAVEKICFGTALDNIVVAGVFRSCGCLQNVFRTGEWPLFMVARVMLVGLPDGHFHDAAGVTIVVSTHRISCKLGEGM